MPVPSADPTLQALIDADFIPSDVALSADQTRALCATHKLEKCADCATDYVNLNRLSVLLTANPTLLCPPPSNIVNQKLTQVVTKTKDEGNVRVSAFVHLLLVASRT
jgi:translocation protein SEC72